MEQIKQEQQFARDYIRFQKAIYSYFYYKTGNSELSTDLSQDTFLKVLSYIQKGNKVENVKALLYKIAGNILVDFYRKRKNESLDSLIEAGFDPIDKDAITDKECEVQNALSYLKRLSENDQQIVTWRFVDGLTPEQISGNMHRDKKTVSVMVCRAVSRLRKLAVK